MSITLGSVVLPAGLRWIDEQSWAPVRQSILRRLNGGVVVFAGSNLAGRSITLEADADYWLSRADAEALHVQAAIPGNVLALAIRNQTLTVMFRHQDAPAVDLAPLVDYDDPADDDPFVGQIKLMTV